MLGNKITFATTRLLHLEHCDILLMGNERNPVKRRVLSKFH